MSDCDGGDCRYQFLSMYNRSVASNTYAFISGVCGGDVLIVDSDVDLAHRRNYFANLQKRIFVATKRILRVIGRMSIALSESVVVLHFGNLPISDSGFLIFRR